MPREFRREIATWLVVMPGSGAKNRLRPARLKSGLPRRVDQVDVTERPRPASIDSFRYVSACPNTAAGTSTVGRKTYGASATHVFR